MPANPTIMTQTQPRPVTYWDYIRVEDLLDLQGGVERDESSLSNDEVMFITVHQIYELWFKLVYRELLRARDLFKLSHVAEQELSGAVAILRRVTTILRRCVDHFEVMETLSTREYLAFRDKLMPASGFQSAQLRQIEILLGLDEGERVPLETPGDYKRVLEAAGGSPALERVERQLADRPVLREAIDAWLYRTPIDGSPPDMHGEEEQTARFVKRYLEAHDRQLEAACQRAVALSPDMRDTLERRYAAERASVHEFLHPEGEDKRRVQRIRLAMIFIMTYRELPLLAWPREVLDSMIELEQVFVIFRQRHARMVERIIGRRTGTGGSTGVDYLDETARRYRVFRDLWAVRTLMIPRHAAPELANAAFYGFKSDT